MRAAAPASHPPRYAQAQAQARAQAQGTAGAPHALGAERHVLITADDFGWTDGHNQAIERAAAAGTLSRASLLTNGAALAGALEVARRCPRLGVGVHLSLCEGRPVGEGRAGHTRALGPLVRPDGAFHDGLGPLVRSYVRGRLDAAAVAREWRAQLERALELGFSLTHLDGHKHVHLLPPLLQITIELAREYGVPYVRVPLEAPRLAAAVRGLGLLGRAPGWLVLSALARRARAQVRAAGLVTNDHFVGFARSGAMTREHLLAAVAAARPGLTEIMVHPALRTPQLQEVLAGYAWATRYRSEDEAAALCDEALRRALTGAAA